MDAAGELGARVGGELKRPLASTKPVSSEAMLRSTLGILVMMVAPVGCGSNAPGPYTVMLSGAYSGAFAINAVAYYAPYTGNLDLIIETVAFDTSFPNYFVFWEFPPGSSFLEAGSYTSNNTNTVTSSLLCEAQYSCWKAGSFQGSLTLIITSVGPATPETSETGDPYTEWSSPHGSLSATMEPYFFETSGTVSANATF